MSIRNAALVFASIATALGLVALLVASTLHLPVLGWVGFGIVSTIVFALGGVAAVVVPRMRVSPPEPAGTFDHEQRLLVVADPHCGALALCDEILTRIDASVIVHLVVPVRVSHLHFLTDDESEERREAEESMLISVGLLQRRGVSASGSVGTDKPLESMTDALGAFPANRVILAIPPEGESYWLEHGLLAKARSLTAVDVAQVVVPAAPPGFGRAGARRR